MSSKKPAAVQVANERKQDEEKGARTVERFGVRARLIPVPEGILEDAERRIEDPPVPIIKDDEQGTEYENPSDPQYLRELGEADAKRGIAAIEAMCLFGVQLFDGLPEDDTWRKKLAFYEKRGHIDLSWVDWESGSDCEVVYSLHDTPGSSLKRLLRLYTIDGVIDDNAFIARHISASSPSLTGVSITTDGVIVFTITAVIGIDAHQASETRVYEIIPKPTL